MSNEGGREGITCEDTVGESSAAAIVEHQPSTEVR